MPPFETPESHFRVAPLTRSSVARLGRSVTPRKDRYPPALADLTAFTARLLPGVSWRLLLAFLLDASRLGLSELEAGFS